VFFLVKSTKVEKKFLNPIKNDIILKYNYPLNSIIYNTDVINITKITLKKNFLKKSITDVKIFKFLKKFKKINFFLFLNKFLLNFLEFFLKSKILFNLKKGSNKLILKQLSSRKFYIKYFKKNLKVTKQIIGILYYSLLLKDSTIFVNFFKKILEKLSIKSHKKVFLGLKKLLKDVFVPLFSLLGVYGLFFNVKGKIGVSGNAKKRRYYFYYGKHSITTRKIKIDIKHIPI
jgi:hypothetical protein